MSPETRMRLRALDLCLHKIEDAQERGDERVTADLAARVGRHVIIEEGSRLSDALETIFRLQEESMGTDHTGWRNTRTTGAREAPNDIPASVGPVQPYTKEEARRATERIKRNLKDVSILLLEAHNRRAWMALGYGSWHVYAKHEFGLSRSRSYEILDQARVVLELQLAAGLTQLPALSPYAASRIKPHVHQVAAEIRRRSEASAGSPEVALQIADQVINETKQKLRSVARHVSMPGSHRKFELLSTLSDGEIRGVICYLAELPEPAECIQRTAVSGLPDLDSAKRALAWLSEFVTMLQGLTPAHQPEQRMAKGA